ncbi:molybdate transport system ATP-binding protein [Cyclobacterium lianum]|uniref:Molybdate transport system ATP-binding protein n=2 Tax=Cyclobacterium lianum TaxID=388280 RepID=A0A1M7PM15_9BACT|nr:molybdate transport system ATP-binding protein [Cyclobacterium lianum]
MDQYQQDDFLVIENATVHHFGKTLFQELNFRVKKGESWAVLGASGKERTAFLETLLGRTSLVEGRIDRPFAHAYKEEQRKRGQVNSFRDLIAFISQKYTFKNKSNQQNFYYQQRFNSSESEDTETVGAYLAGVESRRDGYWDLDKVIRLFDLDQFANKSLIKLSNGETRRLAMAVALTKNPKLFLMDMPLTGLDVQTRERFDEVLQAIMDSGVQVILSTTAREIPASIQHHAWIGEGKLRQNHSRDELLRLEAAHMHPQELKDINFQRLLNKVNRDAGSSSVIQMKDVSIRYGTNLLLDKVNWQVLPGEKWLIKGHNGAGKSTLISLIIGENPQSYANDITLFGRRRGTGESIWEVKKPTGFVSSDLARFFPPNQTCKKVVLSGFFDTMGLFKKTNSEQEALADQWLKALKLSHAENLRLQQVSLEEQRFCLLARAMIKSPKLLVLDEASQGMDEQQRLRFKWLIDFFCRQTGMSLLFVSHYSEDIPDCIDHQIELTQGRITKNTRK